jgi:hypothetical protein
VADLSSATTLAAPSGARTRGTWVDRRAAIYGALLVTTLVAAESRYGNEVETLALSILVAAGVFWLMEIWSEIVARRVDGPISLAQTAAVARHASPMIAAAVIPAMILIAPRLGLLGVDAAINLALLVCVVQLFVWGLLVGRAIGRGWPVALVVAIGDSLLGLLIVSLKVLVIH